MSIKLKIEYIKCDDLKASEYNPRVWSLSRENKLTESIEKYGLIDPLIVNSAKKRKNIVIGGHFRLHVAKKLGINEVPVVYLDIPDIKKEKELNIRLNKNQGEFDESLLKEFFDTQDLIEWGFEEMPPIDNDIKEIVKPEIPFAEEILEANNYIVFTFDNVMDWEVIKDKFDLKTVKANDSTETYVRAGVGRVVNGKELLKKLDNDNS